MPATQIALAGATGNLGLPILQALLKAGLRVTVLSRKGGNSSKLTPHPNLSIKEVDFTSVESLTSALSGIDVVVSCVATLAIGSQNPLVDASVAAGVKRFIPAEFGMDSANELCIQLPVCAPKAATQKYLQEKSDSHPGFTWTAIANGLFLDWGLQSGIIVDLAQHSATLYNGGDVPFSATNLADVAKAVLGIIQHREQTANRIVYIQSTLITQNKLIQYAKEIDGKGWATVVKDTEELRQESLAELAKGPEADVDGAILGFCFVGSFHREYGCDFSDHLDNELLGIKKLSDDDLKDLFRDGHNSQVVTLAGSHGLLVMPPDSAISPARLNGEGRVQDALWMSNVRKRRRGSSSPSLPDDSLKEPSNMSDGLADELLNLWSQRLFTHGFETIFSLSVARTSCPFVDNAAGDVFIPSTKLFGTLDAYMKTYSAGQDKLQLPIRNQQQQEEIDRALDLTIKAFVTRWLPLVTEQLSQSQIDDTIRANWRTARKEMLKLTNRESYRSVLALYLFSQTPIPLGISEDEELDGISGLMCLQSSLLQVQGLRERQKSCHFPSELEGASSWANALASPAHTNTVTNILTTQTYLEYENRAYWAATTWDTSASLTSDYRSSLTSGLKGACSEPAWRLSRAFLVGSFQPQTASWLSNGCFEVDEQAVSLIFSAATIGNLYIWKTIASLKEALREGVEEDAVEFAFNAFLDANGIFTTSIRPLLNHCSRQIHFLNQVHRLNWYKINLRYCLGILVMVDALGTARRSDLLAQVAATTQESEYECLNTLKFGCENTYVIDTLAVSLIAIDPFPEHVTDAVKLMHKVVNRRFRDGHIKHETYTYLISILVEAVQQLPQSSRITHAVREDLERSLDWR